MAGGTQLWDAIKSHKPTILTGTAAKTVELVFDVSLIYYLSFFEVSFRLLRSLSGFTATIN
jgi:hypothetical protein